MSQSKSGSPLNRDELNQLSKTVVQTCRRQGRSLIDFFEQSLVAITWETDSSVPSLIQNLQT